MLPGDHALLHLLASSSWEGLVNRKHRIGLIVGGLLVGFWALPAENVPAKKVVREVYSSQERYDEVQKERSDRSGIYWGYSPTAAANVVPDPIVFSEVKSGLRRAIEGRLKWLGITSSLTLFSRCDRDGEEVVCDYYF